MNNELQPSLQLAEAAPQMPAESRNFMQNVLARGRYALAIGGSVLLAAGAGAYKSQEAEAAAVDDRPPVVMHPGVEGYNDALANDCKINLPVATEIDMKPWSSTSRFNFGYFRNNYRKAVIRYDINDVTVCDGYGKRTALTYLWTKNPKEKRFVRSASVLDKTHHGKRDQARIVDIKRSCKKGMLAKYVTSSVYTDYEGEVHRNTWSSVTKKVNCPAK